MKKDFTFIIKTLGCRVNQAESQEMAESLRLKGWQEGEPPDLMILNTCCVTKKAEKETRQTARALRRKYPKAYLIITGCAVNYWRVKNETPKLGADLLVENEGKMAIPNLPEVIKILPRFGKSHCAVRSFLKVQDGCDQFCAYCIVPYLRGRNRSKKPVEIIEKIKKSEKEGVKEIILCGINLADYKQSFASLLKRILKETNVPRIRLGSINLKAFDDEFIELWQNSRLCPHFHIPLQSASNQALKRMGRKYCFEEFEKVVSKIKRKVKNVNITTDILVGFPGETEKEFEESLKNLKSLKLGKIHVFRYSKREGTRAAKMEGQVAEKNKSERAKKVRELSQKISEEFSNQFIGKKLRVLFEKEKNGWFEGLSENYIKVRSKRKSLMGKATAAKIEKQKGGFLFEIC